MQIMSVGLTADTGLLAVTPQVTVINPMTGCHYFPPGLQLSSQLKSITAPLPVPNYTAWWHRWTGAISLPKAIMQWWPATARTQIQNVTTLTKTTITIMINDINVKLSLVHVSRNKEVKEK